MNAIIGREDWSAFGPDGREERRWIGKPWRRIELLRHRSFYKGEEVECARDLSFHFGFRRLGLGFTFTVIKANYLDYSEEEQ